MSTIRPGVGDLTEPCVVCERQTPHVVTIELRIEGHNPRTDKYSREPYRNTTCQVCGEESSTRMNNA